MKFIYKLEAKFGRFSIKNLPLFLALLFAFNYFLNVISPDLYSKVTLSVFDIVYNHEYWRLFTWIFTTPGTFDEWTIISLVCLYFIGRSAEQGMGTFLYNLYIITSLLTYFLIVLIVGLVGVANNSVGTISDSIVGSMFVTYYITYSVFFAFAIAFKDSTINFFFLFPMKSKYIAAIDFAILAYDYFRAARYCWSWSLMIFATVGLFFLFYHIAVKYDSYAHFSSTSKLKGKKKKKSKGGNVINFEDYVKVKQTTITRHKCAICGKTELDGDELTFRFCSKCNGNYEYCNEHIYTHDHVK